MSKFDVIVIGGGHAGCEAAAAAARRATVHWQQQWTSPFGGGDGDADDRRAFWSGVRARMGPARADGRRCTARYELQPLLFGLFAAMPA